MMCIDKLVIKFQEPRGGFNRRNNTGTMGPNQRLIDLEDIRANLGAAGYRLHDRASGSGRNFYLLSTVVTQTGESTGVVINTRGISSADGDDYAYVRGITANPSHFTRYSDFWAVIEAMNGDEALITQRGYIHRIDYACDYLLPIQTIMQGLHVSGGQTLLAYDDFANDDPYGEYRWNKGNFFSFKIGAGNKSLKIYDKGREEIKRLRSLERRLAEQVGEDVPDDEDIEFDDDEDEDDDDTSYFQYEAQTEQIMRQRLAELRQNIVQYERRPRTRIELSLNTPAVVRKAWDSGYGFSSGSGRPRLTELHDHFMRIETGQFSPFRGVLLNTIDMRGADLEKRTQEAIGIRHDVENGLLMNMWKRMGRRFWSQHRRYFRIYPWHIRHQPTAVFKSRFWYWFSYRDGLTTLGALIPDNCHKPRPITRQWPMNLTHPVAQRLRQAGHLPPPGAN